MKYEALLDEALGENLIVKEKPLQFNNGRIKGNRIAIRKDMNTIEKSCVLAEELGHHHTTVGNILDLKHSGNAKQEHQARLWAYNRQLGLCGIIRAFNQGCQNKYEVAEFLEITEEFLEDAIECYRDKYGVGIKLDNYYIMFIPSLQILKML